jgi:glycosyltransferase involved in cell wall biosynthesis
MASMAGRVRGIAAAVRTGAARLALTAVGAANRRRADRPARHDVRRVRILLVHAYGMGGTIRTVFNLAGYLARDHDVEIVSALRTRERPFFEVPPGVRLTTLDDRTAPKRPAARLLSRLPARLVPPQEKAYKSFSLYTELCLIRHLRSLRGGVVVATRPAFTLLTALFAPPEVITIGQEHVTLDSHAPAMRRLFKRRYGRLDAFVTLTEADRRAYTRLLKANPPRRLLRIPNAIPPLGGATSGLDGKVAVSVGRMAPAKGFDLLVKAWRQVADRHPDWVLRIYGSGSSAREDRLRAQIAKAGLTGTVRLMGSTPDVGPVLAGASMYVLSSRLEGFGMTILEAMSKGVPVAAFDCPHGPREIITNERDGLLARRGRPAALARAVCRLIEDEELRRALGRAAQRTSSAYELGAVGRQWDALLADLLADRLDHRAAGRLGARAGGALRSPRSSVPESPVRP